MTAEVTQEYISESAAVSTGLTPNGHFCVSLVRIERAFMPNEDNHARVGKALLLLQAGLRPYVEREMAAAGLENLNRSQASRFPPKSTPDDVEALLSIMESNWNAIFGQKLGRIERIIVNELREYRNRWAHQKPFDDRDTDRVIDSTEGYCGRLAWSEKQRLQKICYSDLEAIKSQPVPLLSHPSIVKPNCLIGRLILL